MVNHPIQKLNLSTNLKKEFSNYVIFGWHSNHHGFVLTRYIHSAPILVANLFMSPRDKMSFLPELLLRPAEMSDRIISLFFLTANAVA